MVASAIACKPLEQPKRSSHGAIGYTQMRLTYGSNMCLNRIPFFGNVTFINITLEPNEMSAVTGQTVGYARVSSTSQNIDRQLSVLRDLGCTRTFQEKLSGAIRKDQSSKPL